MTRALLILAVVCLLVGITGCPQQPTTSTTKGTVTIDCDESVYPVMLLEAEDFHRSYSEATVHLRSVEAREAIANFANDSVRVMVSARPFNKEEQDYLRATNVEFQEYKVALDAIAVIVHKENPHKQFRMTELDSVFSGELSYWPWKKKTVIDVVIGDINSSTNEVFRNRIMGEKPFSSAAIRMSSSKELIQYVQKTPAAIGIVGLNWLQGYQDEVSACKVGDPNSRPDTTQVMGQYYSPIQANVHRRYYPITRLVSLYTREVSRDVGLGFIAYVGDGKGQQIFLNNGLVPVTMPVRLVETTSKPVTPE